MGLVAPAFTLTWATAKELNPPALAGTAMAIVNTGVFLGPAIYQPLVGWVLDRSGFGAAIAVLAGLSLLAPLSALLVTETRCRNVTVARPAPGT
jgi:MFS family permease